MQFTLRGDYFNGEFSSKDGLSAKDIKDSAEKITKFCPGNTEQKLWDAAINYKNIDAVIESAEDGFKKWRTTSLEQRVDYLKKFQTEVELVKEHIAMAIALETGKPLWEAKTEANAISAKVNVTIADSLKRIENKKIENVLPHIDGHIIYKPLGPCLVIGPYNFPCHLANGQILSALLTGNSIIFKPSEKTMYSSQLLIECLHKAGFPKGVINFINGTAHTTQKILKHPSLKGIFFTGSYAVGKKILEAVGTDLTKLVALELGGKNSTIIHHDTHIEHAITELLRACFLSTGQRCTSTSTIIIHKKIEQEFIEKFKQATQKIRVDHPTEFKQTPFMGPLIDEHALNKYNQSLEMGEKNGAEVILENKQLNLAMPGHYISPSIHYLEHFEKTNPFTQEEIFGPNCTFTSYTEIEEAIQKVNITDYGLADRSTVGASSRLPFGGVKNSGNHHPAAVSMVDHTVSMISSLETLDNNSRISDVTGLNP